MPSPGNKWIEEIDEISLFVTENFSNLNREVLNFKPNATSWSIAQIIDHLITVNDSYYPTFEALEAGTYSVHWLGKVKFVKRFFGKMILESVQQENKRKTKTFPLWEPDTSDFDVSIFERFSKSQDKMKAFIISMDRELDGDVSISSPANKMIVYTLSRALDIIVAHQRRHMKQAINLLSE